MADYPLYAKPYMIQALIDAYGGQATLSSVLTSVEEVLEEELPGGTCPKCAGSGRIPVNGVPSAAECDNCIGWGRTTVTSTVQTTYGPTQPIPSPVIIDPTSP
jgi:hypothetical protein